MHNTISMDSPSKLPSKFSSILQCKCPRCKKGKIFKSKPTDLKNFRQMYIHCPECGLRYEYEVGFFWSAMYIGYALNVALSVILGVLVFLLFNNPEAWVYIAVIVGASILTIPFNFRYGRVILLYIFIPSAEDKISIPKHHSNPKLN